MNGPALKDLSLGPTQSEADWVRIGTFAVGPTDFDLARRSVQIEGINLDGLKIKAWREKDGAINLLRLAGKRAGPASGGAEDSKASPEAARVPATTAATAPAASPAATLVWNVQLKQFALQAAGVNFQDRSVSPAVTFDSRH